MEEFAQEAMTSKSLKGKRFVINQEDISKLNSEEGCEIKLRDKNTVASLDDDSFSDYESDDDVDQDLRFMSGHKNSHNLRTEYISMVLNVNRDPTKPGPDLGKDSPDKRPDEVKLDIDFDMEHINENYRNLDSYERLLAQKENPFEEISPGRVYKRKLQGGLELKVTDTCVVAYNCALWSEGITEPFDSTWVRHQTIVTDMATDSLMSGLYELLLTCKKNEWCEALIRPEAAFGRLGAMPRIPPNATVFCLLEIVKVVPRNQLPPLPGIENNSDGSGVTFSDLISAADLARKRGNYFMDLKQFKTALQRYKTGIRILEAITYKDEKEEQTGNELILKLYINCARACCELGSCRLALFFCKEAFMIDRSNLKIYYNKMKAWEAMGQTERALMVAQRAMNLSKDPKTYKSFERDMLRIKDKLVRDNQSRHDLYKLLGEALVK